MNSLFRGKHASNNRKILNKLLEKDALSYYTLAKGFGKRYVTIYDRINTLSKQGIIEKKGERIAAKNKRPITLWGLSPLGLWAAAHATDSGRKKLSRSKRENEQIEVCEIKRKGITKCRNIIMQYWTKFGEIYELNRVETEEPFYRFFTQWLKSDEGVLHFLDTFGAWPLAGRGAALGSFRRMIDLALLKLHGAWFEILPAFGVEYVRGEWLTSADLKNPYRALGEIATRHEKFQKLDTALLEVDGPIHTYLEQAAYQELVERLKVPLGETIAKTLAAIPFFVDPKMSPIGVRSATLNLLSPNSFFDVGARIWIEKDAVIIETDDQDNISPEWKDHCDLDVIDARTLKHTIIPARKMPE